MDKEKDRMEGLVFPEGLSEGEITERQWRILEAAIKAFSEKGFEASRTSDIAREAEVAEGTIFRYYKTKKDLLLGLFMPLTIKFIKPLIFNSVSRIMKNEGDEPLEKVLQSIFLDRIRLARKNMPLIKTVMMESVYHPELLETLREKLMPQVVEMVDGYIQQNMQKNAIRQLDPRLITRSVMSLLAGYLTLTSLYPEVFPARRDEEEVEKIVDILLNGIRNREREGDE